MMGIQLDNGSANNVSEVQGAGAANVISEFIR